MATEYTEHTSIEQAIEEVAKGMVDSTSEGSRQVTYKSIEELIKADQYLKAKDAASKEHFGLRFTRLTPPPTG